MVLPCKAIVFILIIVQSTGEPMTAAASTKALINLRVSEDDRDLIDRAASALGKNRSEFMLEASRRAAEDALFDRTLFRLDAERFAAFRSLLDAPPAPNDALARLMRKPAPWET